MTGGVKAGGSLLLLIGMAAVLIFKMIFGHPAFSSHASIVAASFTGFVSAVLAAQMHRRRLRHDPPYRLRMWGQEHRLDERDMAFLIRLYVVAALLLLGGSFRAALLLAMR